jgi:uncharacterized DUF497 family protein
MTAPCLEFEWDPAKNRANRAKHGIDFEDLAGVFDKPVLSAPDHRQDYGEERWQAIGLLDDIPVVIAYAERGERIRIISARKATRHEAQAYFQALQK